jgi:hypothetical protein
MAERCPWCRKTFTPRSRGGRPQRYCSPKCRRTLERALRAWAMRQLAAGGVTAALLQRARCAEQRDTERTGQCPKDDNR